MNYIPFIPLFRFLRIIIKMGGLSLKGVLHLILPWLVKLIILEPFRLTEILLFQKKINNHTITHSPIFILGHFRSGTTYLQCLFSCDSRFGYMTIFQHLAPELTLLYEKTLKKIFQAISNLFKAQNHFHRVPLDWSFPGEEDIGLMNLLCEYSPTWGFMFPKKFKEHFIQCTDLRDSTVREKWKQHYIYLLKKISLQNNQKPLVLKSPPNTARINILKELFPDARFVYISRNPYEVFFSTQRLWDVIDNYLLGSKKGVDKNELIYTSFETLMYAYMEQKSSLSSTQLIEIDYDQLISNPVSTMNKIYSQLQLNEFEYCKTAIEKFVKTQKSYVRLNHKLPEDLLQKIKTKWEPYIGEYEKIKNKV